MKLLFKRSALASALLLAAFGTQAASMDFETSDSDTIVVGATAEKVTLRVTGYKNLQPSATAVATILGSFYISTSSGVGKLAITYAPEHEPMSTGSYVGGTIKNESGDKVETMLDSSVGSSFVPTEINGTYWGVLSMANTTSINGTIQMAKRAPLPVGIYPITLRAALYQP